MLYLKEPVSLSSILEPSAAHAGSSISPTLTKIVGTLGPQSRSVEILEKLLQAGMCVARFDFSWGDDAYHQETLENLRTAVKNTKRLCAVMLDTVGPELQVLKNNNNQAIAIDLQQGETIILTPDKSKSASSNFLPINYADLAFAVKPGDEIFVGQYLFTGSEATSVWLEVMHTQGDDVHCVIKNSAILTGTDSSFFLQKTSVSSSAPVRTREQNKQLKSITPRR
jgi:pyruvate kinase